MSFITKILTLFLFTGITFAAPLEEDGKYPGNSAREMRLENCYLSCELEGKLDLKNQKLLYHTYVAHGKNTGQNEALKFSNTRGSNSSSLGLYSTADPTLGSTAIPYVWTDLKRALMTMPGVGLW